MPINDPALGLSGALTTMQGQPSMSATANLSQAQASSGASELASAARSLESVQGNVSGQTMAIQQMTMAGQQQATNLNMLLNQLSSQVAGLNQAVMQMAGATRMASMPQPMAAQPLPAAGGAGFGQMAMTGGGYAFRGLGMANTGLQAAGGFFGRGGAMMSQPFLGGDIYTGGIRPQLGQEVGMLRGFGMASGFGLRPEMLKTATAAQISGMGRERMANRFEDAALGTIGGIGHLGLALGGESLASAGLSAMGIGGITGFAGSMLLGSGISALGGLAINETMGQAANIRGFGEQFGRNAFRFMDVGRGANGLRMPARSQRRAFGRAMNRMSIDDLTFNDQDITEMFAGMSEQDLMRGMRSTQEVVQRMRQAKETFRLIGQQMGQGIQEASQTMGAIQSLGGDPTGTRGRAMIFGASSVPGLMPGEAMQRMSQFGQQFVSTGTGMQAAELMNASLRIGQNAINRGNLTSAQIAALGGREGVGGSMANLTALYAQSSMGQASMMSGQLGGGIFSTMGKAATRAMDPNRIIELQSGDLKKELLGSAGGFGAQADMYMKLKSIADEYKNSLGLTDRNAMVAALQQLDPNITGVQADAYIKQFEGIPQAMRDKQRALVLQNAEQMTNQAVETLSPFARAKRGMKRLFTPAAEGLVDAGAYMSEGMANVSEDVGMSLTGLKLGNMSLGMNMESMQALRSRGGAQMEESLMTADRSSMVGGELPAYMQAENRKIRARNRLRRRQRSINVAVPSSSERLTFNKMAKDALSDPRYRRKIREAKRILEDDGATSQEKRAATKELLDIVSGGTYGRLEAEAEGGNPSKSNITSMRAIQDALSSELGIDVSSRLMGTEITGGGGMSAADREELDSTRKEIRGMLGVDLKTASAVESPEVQAYINALDIGVDVDIHRKKAEEALGGQGAGLLSAIDELAAGRDDFIASDFNELASLVFEKGDELTRQSRIESTELRSQMTGIQLQKALRGAGIKGFGGRLKSKNFSRIAGGIGGLSQSITPEQLKSLRGVKGGEKYANVLSQLRKVKLEGGISDDEATVLKGLGLSEEQISKIKTEEELGMVGLAALDQGDSAGLTTLVGKRGISERQTEQVIKLAEQVQTITNMLKNLEKKNLFKAP